ncbi:hypothetical protein JCM8202_000111 [Rhodotorula sphaerocarpa]
MSSPTDAAPAPAPASPAAPTVDTAAAAAQSPAPTSAAADSAVAGSPSGGAGGPPTNTPAAAPTAATIANSSNPDAYEHVHAPGQTDNDGLTLRALVSSKEAGVIIGRGGQTIAQIRQDNNVKAGVSKVVPGVPDRVLSIGGTVDSVAKAYAQVARTILENPVPSPHHHHHNQQQQQQQASNAANTTEGATSPSPAAVLTSTPALNPSASASVRLLISHLLIGSVIGKGGSKIRQIQELAHARMVASKEMLPQSTERIVEVTGQPDSVRLAVQEIAKCLIEDWDRSQGTVLYHPGAEGLGGAAAVPGGAILGGAGSVGPAAGGATSAIGNGYPAAAASYGAGGSSGAAAGGPAAGGRHGPQRGGVLTPGTYGVRNGPHHGGGGGRRQGGGGGGGGAQNASAAAAAAAAAAGQAAGQAASSSSPAAAAGGLAGTVVGNESDPNWREQKISIPSDMVGCIIGRGGTKINDIRRQSGSRISIAKTAHDETGERMFVISGLPENNEKALFLLYNQLESEKERRVQSVQEEQQQQQQQQQQAAQQQSQDGPKASE